MSLLAILTVYLSGAALVLTGSLTDPTIAVMSADAS